MIFWLGLALNVGALIAGGYLFRSAFRDSARLSPNAAVLRSVGGTFCMILGASGIAIGLVYA